MLVLLGSTLLLTKLMLVTILRSLLLQIILGSILMLTLLRPFILKLLRIQITSGPFSRPVTGCNAPLQRSCRVQGAQLRSSCHCVAVVHLHQGAGYTYTCVTGVCTCAWGHHVSGWYMLHHVPGVGCCTPSTRCTGVTCIQGTGVTCTRVTWWGVHHCTLVQGFAPVTGLHLLQGA